MILTDVDAVYLNYGKPDARALTTITVAEAESLMRDGALGKGSMEPKVEAAMSFVRRGGERAVIAQLADGLAALKGRAGTSIVK
jgi:carbamate kinase